MDISVIVFASAASGSLTTLVLSEIIGWLKKRDEYKHDIRKEFIRKRIEAYERLEDVIGPLNLVMQDTDGKRCHFVFIRKATYEQFCFDVGLAMKFCLWYSQDITDLLSELNKIQMVIAEPEYDFEVTSLHYERKVQEGKNMYETIWNIKQRLVSQIGKDFENMHKTDFSKLFTIY